MLTPVLVVLAAVAQLPGAEAFLAGDAAQRASQWQQSIAHFEQVVKTDTELTPYAELRIAEARAKTGDYNAAVQMYRHIVAEHEGPWTAIAQLRLAQVLVMQQQIAEAVQLEEQFLRLPVEPWWISDIAKNHALHMMRLPEKQNNALDYYRNVALNSIYPRERMDAAQKLLNSARGEDRAAAALGFFRSASPREASQVLVQAGPMLSLHEKGFDIGKVTALMAPEAGSVGNPFDAFALAHPNSLFTRAWLVNAARAHGEAKRFAAAQMAAFALADHWPDQRDAGDTLNWLARKVEEAQGFAAAVPLYYKMAQASPAHHHADDGMLHVGDTYAAQGNHKEAVRAYEMLGRLQDAKLQDLGYYRAGLLELRAGDKGAAAEAFQRAAATGPGKFYAHRALDRLGHKSDIPVKVDGERSYLAPMTGMRGLPPTPSPLVADAPQFRRLRFFGRYGLEEGEWEALDLLEKLQNDPAHEAIYQAIAEAGFAHTALQFATTHGLGVKNGEKTLEFRRLELPRAYWPEVTQLAKETGVDPYLILAVAKQESTFRATVKSHAGATGVMQLMPKTAAWLEEKDPDIPPGTSSHLTSPLNSIRLGANYLEQMIARSGGNLIYAVASYNGGPGNVDKWRKQFPTNDLDQWIENIPFSETKDYVRKVLGYYMGYHSLYPAPN
jgi:soluble lytic murein transglycosylase-like protein